MALPLEKLFPNADHRQIIGLTEELEGLAAKAAMVARADAPDFAALAVVANRTALRAAELWKAAAKLARPAEPAEDEDKQHDYARGM